MRLACTHKVMHVAFVELSENWQTPSCKKWDIRHAEDIKVHVDSTQLTDTVRHMEDRAYALDIHCIVRPNWLSESRETDT